MDAITRHHYLNIAKGNAIPTEQGLTTVLNVTVEEDGKHTVYPSAWDGKIVKNTDDIVRFSKKQNVKWPSFNSEEAANTVYQGIKKRGQPLGNDPQKAQDLLDGKINPFRSIISQ